MTVHFTSLIFKMDDMKQKRKLFYYLVQPLLGKNQGQWSYLVTGNGNLKREQNYIRLFRIVLKNNDLYE